VGLKHHEKFEWFRNVEGAFVGLNCATRTLHKQMIQQFAHGSALSGFNAALAPIATKAREKVIKAAQAAVTADTQAGAPDATDTARLAATLTAMQGFDNKTVLRVNGIGEACVIGALHEFATVLLPNKIMQRVHRYLRSEARKPIDMGAMTHLMHIVRINAAVECD